ncbi:MAG TPA: hypothetical protein VMU32_09420 [Solirubrobacteraceae bacterium]|nr:hypothetical protein [Solirubrobacteraceae bacterium]
MAPENLHGLGWGSVLKHAWRHIKDSGRVVLGGFVVSAVLPPLYQWWDTYHWSHRGLDEVTGGGWESSLIGVAVWLALVTIWHLTRAPIGHAREVLSARDRRHAAEVARVRAEKAVPIVNVGDRHYHFNFGENPDPAAIAAALQGQVDPEPLRQIGAADEKPTARKDQKRPKRLQNPQVEADGSDDGTDGPGHAESGK